MVEVHIYGSMLSKKASNQVTYQNLVWTLKLEMLEKLKLRGGHSYGLMMNNNRVTQKI